MTVVIFDGSRIHESADPFGSLGMQDVRRRYWDSVHVVSSETCFSFGLDVHGNWRGSWVRSWNLVPVIEDDTFHYFGYCICL